MFKSSGKFTAKRAECSHSINGLEKYGCDLDRNFR